MAGHPHGEPTTHHEICKYCQSTSRVQASVLENLRVQHGTGACVWPGLVVQHRLVDELAAFLAFSPCLLSSSCHVLLVRLMVLFNNKRSVLQHSHLRLSCDGADLLMLPMICPVGCNLQVQGMKIKTCQAHDVLRDGQAWQKSVK